MVCCAQRISSVIVIIVLGLWEEIYGVLLALQAQYGPPAVQTVPLQHLRHTVQAGGDAEDAQEDGPQYVDHRRRDGNNAHSRFTLGQPNRS